MGFQLKMFVLYAFVLWAFGGYVYFKEKFVYSNWTEVQGEITEVETYQQKDKRSDEMKDVYDFTVTYTYEDQQNTVSKTAFSGKPKFKIGDPYPVRVNPANPEETRVSVGSAYFLVMVCAVSGLLFFVTGSFAFFRKRKSIP